MRPFHIGVALLWVAGLAVCACGQGAGGGHGGGGSAAVDCHDVRLLDDPCDTCLHQHCCAELGACFNSPACLYCSAWSGYWTPCERDPERPIAAALRTCAADKCDPACKRVYQSFDGGAEPIPCQDPEPDGGVTFADCTAPDMTVIRGTIFGKPFDQTFTPSHISFSQTLVDKSLTVDLPDLGSGGGKIYFEWAPYLYPGVAVAMDPGTLQLPGESIAHLILQDSTLWGECSGSAYRFSLTLWEGDKLTGCTR
jgi:hypothetical protein